MTLRSVQESPQGVIIRVDDDVYWMLSRRATSYDEALVKWVRRPGHAGR